MKEYDISGEARRTYTIKMPMSGIIYEKTIKNPLTLFFDNGHSFHRVWDGITMWLMPAPGIISKGGLLGVVEMSWIPNDADNPCQF
jgi:hypothetical protein